MSKLFKIKTTTPDCETCKLCQVAEHPNMKFIGEGARGVLILGSSPVLLEDQKGSLGYGKEFSFLEKTLDDMGYNLEKDCYYTTVMGCRLPRNRDPSGVEISSCMPRLEKLIERLDPKSIILLGATPFRALIQPSISKGRMTGMSAGDFYGDCIPDQNVGRWLCPTWSIQELLTTRTYDDGGISKPFYERDKAIYLTFKKHIEEAFVASARSFPIFDTSVETTLDMEKAIDWIEEALDWKFVSFDYETNCRKPHKEGKIYYASISNGHKAYSFPFFEDPLFVKMWKRLMMSSNGKLAHNNQFEATWTKVRGGGYWIKNWIWDTMLTMHCLNNKKRTNLKYGVYRSFGIAGYDADADEYIVPSAADTKKFGAYALNRIDEADPEMVMKYNAMDSLFTAWLYMEQKGILTEFQLTGLKLLVETATTLAKISENGVMVDEAQFDVVDTQLHELLEEAYKEIQEMEDVKQWDGDRPINLASPKQLSHLLFDILKIKPIAYTEKGSPSTDKESLIKMDRPFLRKLIEHREFEKMVSTYIDGWKRETHESVVHSSLNLNTVDTFRSSSDSPNIQVSYKRDPKKKKIVRSLIRPRNRHKICEYDYKSLEVIVNGCHSNDKSLVKYCTDPSTDMHRDGSCDAFILQQNEVDKDIRGAVKGLYIFAEFYGSYYKGVAKGLWDYAQGKPDLMNHMRLKGIGTYATFESHIEKCEKKLWGERFREHDLWRKLQWSTYQKKGYLESFTGFRLQCPMSKNNSFNGLVQGDGFHCLCYLMNHLQAKIEELGLNSMIINEIHDSLVLDVDPAEESIIDYWVYVFGVKQLMEDWKWITIPLAIEKESSEIDGSWAEMKGCGFLGEF